MKNKIIIPSFLFIVVLIFSFFTLAQENDKKQPQINEIMEQEIERSDDIGEDNAEKQEISKIANQGIEKASEIILFYGDGCPHCAIVEEYVSQNNVEAKVSFAKKEVYYNKQNADTLVAKAKICGMSTDSIGVPFLWDGSKCFVGDQDIIKFFKSKINKL